MATKRTSSYRPRKPSLGRGDARETLGARARQVFDLLGRKGALTAAEVHQAFPDLPSYSAARASLRVLEEKGLARHRREGGRYVYRPTAPPDDLRRSALRHLIDNLFAGSVTDALQAFADVSGPRLEDEERTALEQLIEQTEARERSESKREGNPAS